MINKNNFKLMNDFEFRLKRIQGIDEYFYYIFDDDAVWIKSYFYDIKDSKKIVFHVFEASHFLFDYIKKKKISVKIDLSNSIYQLQYYKMNYLFWVYKLNYIDLRVIDDSFYIFSDLFLITHKHFFESLLKKNKIVDAMIRFHGENDIYYYISFLLSIYFISENGKK